MIFDDWNDASTVEFGFLLRPGDGFQTGDHISFNNIFPGAWIRFVVVVSVVQEHREIVASIWGDFELEILDNFNLCPRGSLSKGIRILPGEFRRSHNARLCATGAKPERGQHSRQEPFHVRMIPCLASRCKIYCFNPSTPARGPAAPAPVPGRALLAGDTGLAPPP